MPPRRPTGPGGRQSTRAPFWRRRRIETETRRLPCGGGAPGVEEAWCPWIGTQGFTPFSLKYLAAPGWNGTGEPFMAFSSLMPFAAEWAATSSGRLS